MAKRRKFSATLLVLTRYDVISAIFGSPSSSQRSTDREAGPVRRVLLSVPRDPRTSQRSPRVKIDVPEPRVLAWIIHEAAAGWPVT